MRRRKIADSTGADLTGAGTLTGALLLRRFFRREVLAEEEKYVGLLVPPSVGGVLANAALAIDGRVAVNLNYTVSSGVMNHCIRKCGIRHVLTTRRVMERFPLEIDAELVYLEDLKEKIHAWDKILSALAAWLVPVSLLVRRLGLTRIDPDDALTVIFTSGSTGEPKGVVLSHRNVGSNVQGFSQVLDFNERDVMVGILPLFHSFGYTCTMWTAMTLKLRAVYHYIPLEARQVGKLAREQGATIVVATPTFLRSYLKRCSAEDFATVNTIIAGAEKLPVELIDAFEAKFGVRPFEGYGTTELSPVVAANVPPTRSPNGSSEGLREGTVGRCIPGVAAKVVDPDTGEDLGTGRSGMLLVTGTNVMQGYLDQPDLTAEVLHDGWYTTGDIAMIDDEGFIHITGRESRFSKIGGEMVPHLRLEETLNRVLDIDDETLSLVVSAVPDERKGERLVVLHTGLNRTPDEICQLLREAGLPPLWIPSPDSFHQVGSIPVLGTGKLDLRHVKELALEQFGR